MPIPFAISSHHLLGASLVLVLSISTGCTSELQPPSGPEHPADPNAAQAPEPPPPSVPAAEPTVTPAHGGAHGATHEHGTDAAPAGSTAHEHPSAAADEDALIAAEMAAYQAAKPVFDAACARCHTSTVARPKRKALEHFAMDSYPFSGHHAGELGATIRKALGVDGGKATMPKDDPGALTAAELELIIAWSHAYDRAQQAGAGYHGETREHEHDHGKPPKQKKEHHHGKPRKQKNEHDHGKPAKSKTDGHQHH